MLPQEGVSAALEGEAEAVAGAVAAEGEAGGTDPLPNTGPLTLQLTSS